VKQNIKLKSTKKANHIIPLNSRMTIQVGQILSFDSGSRQILKLDFNSELQICMNCIIYSKQVLELSDRSMHNPVIIS
jgi:hypothetical protein